METTNDTCMASRDQEKRRLCRKDGDPDASDSRKSPLTLSTPPQPRRLDLSTSRQSLLSDSAFPAQHDDSPENLDDRAAGGSSREENSLGSSPGIRCRIIVPLPSAKSETEDELHRADALNAWHMTGRSSSAGDRDKHALPRPRLVSALKQKGREKCKRTISLPECQPADRSAMVDQKTLSELGPDAGVGSASDVLQGYSKRESAWSSSRDCAFAKPRYSSSSESSDRSPPPCGSGNGSPSPATAVRRRISFPADSVLTAVIQDGDTAELLRLLSGREGPGVVQTPGGSGAAERRGVDVRQTNHVGLTALHHAILANNLDAAKLLLCHGADVNAQDVHGFSPLHTAAACGSLPLTSLLLLFGGDVFALTREQELPIDVAKDLRITRLLAGEMVRLVHEDLWLMSFVRARAADVWVLLRRLLTWIVLVIVHLLPKLWKSIIYHEKRN